VRRLLRPLVFAGLVATLVVAGHRTGLSRYATADGMRELVEGFGAGGPLAFMGVAFAGVLLHLPAILFIAAGAIVFGPVLGFAYGWVASVAGATASFLLARYVLRGPVRQGTGVPPGRLQRLDERLARHGFRTVLVLRVLFFMAPPLNWAMGATSVHLGQYVAATALGIVPGTCFTVLSADTISRHGLASALRTPEGFVPLALAVAVAMGAVVASRRWAGTPPAPRS